MPHELISVVISTYNVSKYLVKTMNSILSQTYNELEIVVIDDGSTDETIDILKEYVRRYRNVRVHFREHTGNIGRNLNDCIRYAKGNIIAIHGADDLWMPNKIETQLKYLSKDKIVCSNGNIINGSDKIVIKRFGKYSGDFYIDLKQLLQSSCILSSSVLAYKAILIECGLFDEEIGNRSEDYILWLNIASRYRIKCIDQILVSYRIHGENLSSRSFTDRKEILYRNIEILSPFLKNKDKNIIKSAMLGLCFLYSELVKIYYLEHDISNSHLYCRLFVINYNKKFSLKYLKYLLFFIYVSIFQFIRRFVRIRKFKFFEEYYRLK